VSMQVNEEQFFTHLVQDLRQLFNLIEL